MSDNQLVRDDERELFDDLLDEVLAEMPEDIHRLMEEVPLIVEDHPGKSVAEEFGLEHLDELCGLHDGIPLTERSVEIGAELPPQVYLYRAGILAMSEDDDGLVSDAELRRQIRITLLHEIGHHFGFEEDDLRAMGYE